MNIVRLIAGIFVGLISITLVVESIEFLTVKLLSGQSFEYLKENQEEYFKIRNQRGVLFFKVFYNFIAAMAGGYVATWIAKPHAKIAAYLLIGIQLLALIWAGFFSELSGTGPIWMWVILIIITPMGIFAGYRTRIKV